MFALCQSFRSVSWGSEWLNNTFKGTQLLSEGSLDLTETRPTWPLASKSLSLVALKPAGTSSPLICTPYYPTPGFPSSSSFRDDKIIHGSLWLQCFLLFWQGICVVFQILCVKLVICMLTRKPNHIYSRVCCVLGENVLQILNNQLGINF